MSVLAGAPTGWTERTLGELSSKTTVGFVGSMSHLFLASGVPLLRGTNVHQGSLDLRDMRFISEETHRRWAKSALVPGDIVMVRVGYPGTAAVVPDDLGAANAASLVIARPKPAVLNPKFAMYVINSPAGVRQLQTQLVGGAQQVFNTTLAAKLLIPVPPLEEQNKIVEALEDVDGLVKSLQTLISKKRAIKQGMMQELLTGRARLPGFDGEWHLRQIGDFAQVKAGGTPSTTVSRYWGGHIRWMSSGEVHQKRVREVSGRITSDGLRESSAQLLPVGTVLMALAGQGKTRGTVAVSRVELSTNQSIAGIFPSDEHDSDFLFYNLDTRYEELRGESSGGSGRGGLNLTIIKKLDVRMPPVPEQQAIAAVLRDDDDEIEALERRLEATRAIRQGMMQELLTGRTRLVREGAA